MTITLATLPKATAQEVYSQVRRHLLQQGRPSLLVEEGKECAYHGNNGLKCAAGCLISDTEYRPEFEEKHWSALVAKGFVPDAHLQIIVALQTIHDIREPKRWEHYLNELASWFNLEPK